ncbi:MAG: methionine adenosyltransferase domain-containing protein [Candidatus Nomurabacteria bacterium]|nr:MAG: methionine adenosyltransferase domain-containing protein [Candidatus Nomurabacteria bacterium]
MSTLMKTAESVTPSHPDKICDQISDAILDACLKEDPNTRAAIEVLGGHGLITICGELTTKAHVNMRDVATRVYKDLGYKEQIGVTINVVEQSPEIGSGVDAEGAGDQGIMVGYATSETSESLPLELVLARKLTKAMGPRDGKAQVTVQDGKVVKVLTSVCEHCDYDDTELEKVIEEEITPHLHEKVTGLKDIWMRNPNGRWTVGGFAADTGLTGRKLAVDNYGPNIPLGGGCFSGKDATKVDRSGAYMARRIAVDYLKERKASEVYVHLAYAIGVAEPVMAVVTIDGVQEEVKGYDLKPQAIIKTLDLKSPKFEQTAKHGHFGNGFSWDA